MTGLPKIHRERRGPSLGHAGRSLVALLLLGLVSRPGVAQETQQLTLIAPRVEPVSLRSLGSELGAAIQRAVAESAGYAAFNQAMLDPSEVILMFGCVQLDAQCAHEAAREISDGALFARLTGSLDHGLDVRLAIIDADAPAVRRGVVRTLRTHDGGPIPAGHLPPVFRHLAHRLLSDQSTEGAELYLIGEAAHLHQRPVEAHTVHRIHRGRHHVMLGGNELEFDVRDGEVVFVTTATARATAPVSSAQGYRVGGWMATGVSVAAASGGLLLGHQMRLSEEAYLRAKTRGEAVEHQTRGENQALAANVLFSVAAAAAITAVTLFLLD